MEQFDQLLTCCVCLDRFKNPKLLPCQHSYCMEPCLEGLVDYVKRQVKCPECRAEHRIPYNGIQGFPSNFTLQKFLELHADITGELPDPNADAIMSRCNVCSEKAYVNPCAHCDKKVCDDCKEAHCDILKREIVRVNNQVKRGFHRIEEFIQQVERNQQQLQQNANSVIGEVEEIQRRLSMALKERTEFLKNNVDKYQVTEMKNLKELRNNLDLELQNIQSNSDLMEKHMSEDSCKWDDNELMDCKDIFIKMMDFIRNYDPGNEEYSRRIRFTCHDGVNDIARKILEIGELKINDPKPKEIEDSDIPIRSSGLARSKSDHRLVAEFRRRGDESERSPPRRRFGDIRYSREENKSRTNFGRYGDDDDDGDSGIRGSRFRSRFLRPDDDDDSGNRKSLHMDDDDDSRRPMKKEKVKVLDTEDASRGALSGCIRLADSSRIIQRLKEWEMFKLKPKKKEEPPPVYKFVPLKPNPELAMAPLGQKKSEDEVEKIKKDYREPQTQTLTSTPAPSTASTTSASPAAAAAAAAASRYAAASQVTAASTAAMTPAVTARSTLTAPAKLAVQASQESATTSSEEEDKRANNAEVAEEEGDSDEYEYYDYDEEEEEEAAVTTTAPSTTSTTTLAKTTSPPVSSYTSASSSQTSRPAAAPTSTYASMRAAAASSVAPTTSVPATTAHPPQAAGSMSPTPLSAEAKQKAYVGSRTMPNIGNTLSSSQETEDESSSAAAIAAAARNSVTARYRRIRDDSESFVNKYLAQSRTANQENGTKPSASMPAVNQSMSQAPATSTSSSGATTTTPTSTRKISDESQYPSGRSRYAALKERKSRVARSKSSAVLGTDQSPEDDEEEEEDEPTPFTSRFGRELARSRSSHLLKNEEAPNPATGVGSDDDNLSSWARYLKNKYGGRKKTENTNNVNSINNCNNESKSNNMIISLSGPKGQYLQKQTLLMTFGSRGSQPGLFTWPRGIAVGPDNSIVVADSSNHRVQIFNEMGQHRFSFGCYGNGDGEFDCLAGVAVNRIGQYIIADRYNHRIQIFDPSGHFLRAFGCQGTSDGKFSYPWGITTDALGFIYVCDKENHRIQVFQSDGTFVGKFGSMGSKAGQLEHPHYIAVSNTNRVIVSDSNNHRIQVFDVNGKVLSMFGSEGTDEGQFKFPRGVAVDEQGYIFVADSGNNRIQIFNPDGTFLRGFGRWGQGDGEFKGLEGIAVNSKGNVLVADRENHRVQMF